jgi:hypothetical protein
MKWNKHWTRWKNSKIIKWLDPNDSNNKSSNDSNNTKYYILLLLLVLGGTTWYYYGPDITPPGWGFIIGSLQAFRNTINEIRSINRTARDISTTVKETIDSAKDYLRKRENNSFELESKDILTSITNWHSMEVNPLNKEDIKVRWESYKILETRIKHLQEKFPEDFKIWMADRYSAVSAMINNFWNIGPRIFSQFHRRYGDMEQDTLIIQKEWSEHGSVRSNPLSPEMLELSVDQATHPAPPAPPIPKAPPAPPAPTEHGVPSSLLEQITKGKSLKKVETKINDNSIKGKLVSTDETPIASSSKTTLESQNTGNSQNLRESLSAKFNQMRKSIIGSDDGDQDIIKNVWEDEIDYTSQIVENKTPVEVQSAINKIWDNIRTSVNNTPKPQSLGLHPELPPLTELDSKLKDINSIDELDDEDKNQILNLPHWYIN